MIYKINNDDIITFVDQEWLEFAQKNEAPELTKDSILGTLIWRFISGDETKQLYQHLFERIRKNKTTAAIPFNCDSPTVKRSLDLSINALEDDSLVFTSTVISITPCDKNPLLDPSQERSSEIIKICSFCKNVYFEGAGWKNVERALLRLNLNYYNPLPKLKNTVCSDCKKVVEAVF